jgi:hypothetical protein
MIVSGVRISCETMESSSDLRRSVSRSSTVSVRSIQIEQDQIELFLSGTELVQRVADAPMHGERADRPGFAKLMLDDLRVPGRVLYQQDAIIMRMQPCVDF